MRNKIILSFLSAIILLFGSFELSASRNWTKTFSGGKPFGIYSLGDYVFAATDHGLFRSTDHGTTWEYKGEGIGSYAVTYMYKKGSRLFAGVYERGILKSDDNGNTWQLSNSGIKINYITGISSNSKYLFASAIAFCQPDSGSVYRSSDDGATWTEVNDGLNACVQRLLYGVVAGEGFAHVSTEVGAFRSSDDGATWTESTTYGRPSDCKTAFYHNGRVYVSDTQGAYMSSDSAKTWEESYGGMLEYMAFMGDTIFACGHNYHDVMISSDGGKNWAPTTFWDNWGVQGIAISGGNIILASENDDNYGLFVTPIPGYNSSPNDNIAPIVGLHASYSESDEKIRFSLMEQLHDVSLSFYDINGTLITKKEFASAADLVLDAASLPSGIYFAALRGEGNCYSAKVSVIR